MCSRKSKMCWLSVDLGLLQTVHSTTGILDKLAKITIAECHFYFGDFVDFTITNKMISDAYALLYKAIPFGARPFQNPNQQNRWITRAVTSSPTIGNLSHNASVSPEPLTPQCIHPLWTPPLYKTSTPILTHFYITLYPTNYITDGSSPLSRSLDNDFPRQAPFWSDAVTS